MDLLRLIAVTAIYFHHTLDQYTFLSFPFGKQLYYAQNSLGYGLFISFLISPFLITTQLFREQEKFGSIDVPMFYTRRFLRIWPICSVIIAAGMAIEIVFYHTFSLRALCYLFMLGNWYIFRYGITYNIYLPLWSISVQEQFYLLWPLILRKRSKLLLALIASGVFLVALLAVYSHGQHHYNAAMLWYNGLEAFGIFALGVLLASCFGGQLLQLPNWARCALLLVGAGCWFSSEFFFHFRENEPAHSGADSLFGYLLAAAGALAIVLAILAINTKHFPRWVFYLGRISFGIYALHLPVVIALRAFFKAVGFPCTTTLLNSTSLLSLPLVILAAHLSYKYFESWFLARKPQHRTERQIVSDAALAMNTLPGING